MTEISKSEAIVLRKTNFSDSSLIVQLFTKEHGKMSAIIKGARSAKSKIGSKIDLLNHTEVVFYKKDSREIQLLTQANLIHHFPIIKEDLDKIKYASAVCELLQKLIPEHEPNEKIFRGVIKILSLMNNKETDSELLFAKFLVFLIRETGYEISFKHCSSCGEKIESNTGAAFSYSEGIICESCNTNKELTFEFSEELFNLFKCLTTKNNIDSYKKNNVNSIIFILEKFLEYHIPDFRGIKSLKMF